MIKINAKEDHGYVSKYSAEFKDKKLEEDFFEHEIKSVMKYMKPILLIFGGLYLLFMVPDYFLIKDDRIFKIILINRIFILILVILLHLKLKKEKRHTNLPYWFTAYEIVVSLSFLLNFYNYDSPNFFMLSWGVMIIVLTIFLVPNKWKYTIFTSVLVSISFFLLSLNSFESIKISEFSASVVYMTLVIVLSSIYSYSMNYNKRMQYLSNRKLIKMSVTDTLTGIYNRAKFNHELVRWIELSKMYKSHLSLVIFDIDDFKKINDSHGHLAGDKVLVDAVKIVTNNMRKSDVFARWGGEEFVILLPNTEIQDAMEMTERLRVLISEYVFDGVGHVSCSFGVVSLKEEDNVDTFLHRADQRLYLAKGAGKNMVL